MHYWSKCDGASVYFKHRNVGHIEDVMINPAYKTVIAFVLERKNTEMKYRYFLLAKSEKIEREGITLERETDIKILPGTIRKQHIFIEDILNKSIVDEKGKWVGKVVDFAFDKSDGKIKEVVISNSIMQDLWLGRSKMPVFSTVEFSDELVRIDKNTKESIKELQKGIKNWIN